MLRKILASAPESNTIKTLQKVHRTLTALADRPHSNIVADRDLIALGRRFIPLAIEAERLMAIFHHLDSTENADLEVVAEWRVAQARLSKANDRVTPIANEICSQPAHSIAGMMIKAAVALYCNGDDYSTEPEINLSHADNNSVPASIVCDLLRLADWSDHDSRLAILTADRALPLSDQNGGKMCESVAA